MICLAQKVLNSLILSSLRFSFQRRSRTHLIWKLNSVLWTKWKEKSTISIWDLSMMRKNLSSLDKESMNKEIASMKIFQSRSLLRKENLKSSEPTPLNQWLKSKPKVLLNKLKLRLMLNFRMSRLREILSLLRPEMKLRVDVKLKLLKLMPKINAISQLLQRC